MIYGFSYIRLCFGKTLLTEKQLFVNRFQQNNFFFLKKSFNKTKFRSHLKIQQIHKFHNQFNQNKEESWWKYKTYNQSNFNYKRTKQNFSKNYKFFSTVAPLLSLSWIVTIKDVLGIEKVKLDKDSIKDKIKQAMLHRRYNRYVEAIEILHAALREAQDTKIEKYVTRIYDELANTYYEMDNIEEAFNLFKEVVQRLIRLEKKTETSPEFIGISLKMADIFARRGDLTNAEIGFKHCVSKQLKMVEEHKKNYLIEKGAYIEEKHPVEKFGPKYSDPIALFGMALELYAVFLLEYFEDKRLNEVEEFMDEVLKISYHLYGSCSSHTINIINNFAAKCLFKKQFSLSRKYLEIGLNRVLNIDECEPIIVSYYCNYAEALFHTNDVKKAIEYAQKAEILSRSQEPRVQKFAQNFLRDIEKDARRNKKLESRKIGWFF